MRIRTLGDALGAWHHHLLVGMCVTAGAAPTKQSFSWQTAKGERDDTAGKPPTPCSTLHAYYKAPIPVRRAPNPWPSHHPVQRLRSTDHSQSTPDMGGLVPASSAT